MMAAGILCLALAASLIFYNLWDGERAGRASDAISARLERAILDDVSGGEGNGGAASGSGEGGVASGARESGGADAVGVMPTRMIDGYLCIGELEIPSLHLTLPVLADWSYDDLKVSPCRYAGSYLTNDLVICGHNYRRHFSPIKWIDPGAAVNLIAADGQMLRYVVSRLETVNPTSVDTMLENRNNAGSEGVTSDWDLTLFTCSTGGRTRCAVRCVRAEA